MDYEWDPDKDRANWRRHRVSFDEARTVLEDELARYWADEAHSDAEERFIVLGRSRLGRVLVVVHSERDERVRIISARRATRHEQAAYEEEPI